MTDVVGDSGASVPPEHAEEVEALRAIYGADCRVTSTTPTLRLTLTVSVSPGVDVELTFALVSGYPNSRGPAVDARIRGSVDFIESSLLSALSRHARSSLGSPMIFTLAETAKEWLSNALENGVPSDDDEGGGEEREVGDDDHGMAERMSRTKEEEEKERARGTAVTRESFRGWWDGFVGRREEEARRQAAVESLRMRSVEERKAAAKLTGRQMFEKDGSLATSDASFLQQEEQGGSGVAVPLEEPVEEQEAEVE